MQSLFILVILSLAVFTQTLTGFGSALVAMALLPAVVGLRIAVPLVALFALALEVVLLIHFRQSVQLRAVRTLALGALAGIPAGILMLRSVNERAVLAVLGAVITGYSLYALIEFVPPRMAHGAWPYVFGFLAGLLGGAYNVSGPPVVVYGSCAGWSPKQFKANLQGFFVFSSLAILFSHAVGGNLTGEVWRLFPIALAAVGLGVLAGTLLDRYMNPAGFRRNVLMLLLVMGVKFILLG
ncbi:MAG TPA: sulfite exporter TauE/SafE family protein [Anaerolineales bacterium]|nr:sulfite exporter TauE/SafE family protein [Anaerolineales bacterium]